MRFAELRFSANLLEGARADLPAFLGSTLRGAFGYLLKQAVCQVRDTPCPNCLLSRACPYPNLFEGLAPIARERMRRYPQIPQPFVLLVDPPHRAKKPTNCLRWGIRLFGDSVKFWPYVVYIFKQAGERGIGKNRVRYELESVFDQLTQQELDDQGSEPCIRELDELEIGIPPRCQITWRFNTPLRLVRNENLLSRRLAPLDLVIAGKRRFETLTYFFGDQQRLPEMRRFEQDEFVVLRHNLRAWGFRRYSGRQQRSMELAGLLGEVEIEGPWGDLAQLMTAAPVIHLGKATTFGFGQVEWNIT